MITQKIYCVIALTFAVAMNVGVCMANPSSSSNRSSKSAESDNLHAKKNLPKITNEEEYAEFVKKREGAGETSSVKSTQAKKSVCSIKSSLSSAASSSRSKYQATKN